MPIWCTRVCRVAVGKLTVGPLNNICYGDFAFITTCCIGLHAHPFGGSCILSPWSEIPCWTAWLHTGKWGQAHPCTLEIRKPLESRSRFDMRMHCWRHICPMSHLRKPRRIRKQ